MTGQTLSADLVGVLSGLVASINGDCAKVSEEQQSTEPVVDFSCSNDAQQLGTDITTDLSDVTPGSTLAQALQRLQTDASLVDGGAGIVPPDLSAAMTAVMDANVQSTP